MGGGVGGASGEGLIRGGGRGLDRTVHIVLRRVCSSARLLAGNEFSDEGGVAMASSVAALAPPKPSARRVMSSAAPATPPADDDPSVRTASALSTAALAPP